MPRPQRCRRICTKPKFSCFNTDNQVESDIIYLSLDEYETIRLVDYERLTHEECAKQMDISRTTVSEIYENARYKIADCIVNGKQIRIEGGKYRVCDGTAPCYCTSRCKKASLVPDNNLFEKGVSDMKIAVTFDDGNIFQHFGHTEQFKFYTVKDGKIISSEVVNTNGSGHGALAGFLSANSVDTLICGGIGGGAQTALAEAGIKLYGGVSGNADEAVNALIAEKLIFNPDVHCDHHDHENHNDHKCGEHGCGNHNCH